MCERCVDAVRKHFPDVDDDRISEILWEHTAFPMGQPDQIERQVAEYSAEIKGRNWA